MKNFLSDIFWYLAMIVLFIGIMLYATNNYKIILFLTGILVIFSFNKNVVLPKKEKKEEQ